MDVSKPTYSIAFFKSLAYKLLRASLGIALVLGVVGAAVQVSLDFSNQHSAIESRVKEVFRVSENSAQHAVHLLDNRLADEVVKGVQHYDFILKATIFDDSGRVMARHESEPKSEPSSTRWLTRLFTEEKREYSSSLVYPGGAEEGYFVIVVDNDTALAPFYDRALTIFVSGVLRNAGLAIVLMGLYHLALTRPLLSIARDVSQIDPSKADGRRIEPLRDHKHDELAQIIKAINQTLGAVEEEQSHLRQSTKQLRLILDSSPSAVYALNEAGNFVFLNQATADFYGASVDELIDKNCYLRHKMINSDEADRLLVSLKDVESNGRARYDYEGEATDYNGLKHIFQISYIPFDFYQQRCVLVVAYDITGRVEAEKQVESLAYFDTLTNLPNRNMLFDRLSMDISRSQRDGTYGALMYIDLDDFKRVNDTMGHSVGDQLLLRLTESMKSQVRQTDTLARLGGDEFTLSMPDLSSEMEVAKTQASELAGRLLSRLSQPINMGSYEFNISASIGVVLYPQRDENAETLLRYADTAMYKAKQGGRNAYLFFEQSMAVEADRLVRLEAEIRNAIRESQFVFYLQPQVNSKNECLSGAEALVRWNHPEKGLLSPAAFLDFLESSGMISEVDRQVFRAVCEYGAKQYRAGTLAEGFRFSVNLSSKELHRSSFVQDVKAILKQTGLPARFIELEITESAALIHLEEVIERMEILQSIGITFALDDFGTGYSSLSYLKQLPVNKVKIDKSFIKDLTFDKQDEALVASIVAIAETMGLTVVAEGLETDDQKAWLGKYGNIIYQGYLYDKPLDSEAFAEKYLLPNKGDVSPVIELRPGASDTGSFTGT